MMIRPNTRELEHVISIALKTAPDYALRNVMSERGKMNRQIAVQKRLIRARDGRPLWPYQAAD